MAKRYFYLDAGLANGPHGEPEIRRLHRLGRLAPGTRCWHDGAEAWRPLESVLAEDSAVSSSAGAASPVRRYLARLFDIAVCGMLAMAALSVLLYAIAPQTAEAVVAALSTTRGRLLDMLLIVFLGAMVAVVPTGLTGRSPGKWLFGLQVVDVDGHPPGLRLALARELHVWVRGLALGLPVVSLLALGLSYRSLSRHGRTAWDRALGLDVRVEPFDRVRGLSAACGLVLAAVLLWALRG